MAEVQNDPDRVTHPLKRNAAGEFERVSWDEALDDIGDRLGRILDGARPGCGRAGTWATRAPSATRTRCGARASSTASARRTPTAPGSQDVNNRFAASALHVRHAAGGPDPGHRAHGLPLHGGGQPAGLPRVGAERPARARAPARDRGAAAAGWCASTRAARRPPSQFEHQPIRPDGDAWLLLSMIHTIFDEGLADEGFLDAHTDGWSELRRFAADHPPEATEARTGIAPERVRELARDFAGSESAAAYGRTGRLPGALRHARGLPARRAERRDRQRRPPGRQRVRRPADPARRDRRADRARHLRRGPRALRRLPRRAGRDAGLAAPAGDHHPGRAPDPRAVRVRRQPGAVGARRRRAGGRLRGARPDGVARLLRERDQPPRRLRAAHHHDVRARRRAGGADVASSPRRSSRPPRR